MGKVHSARIHWSTAQTRRGLPTMDRSIDPAWLDDARPGTGDGWSLVCQYAVPPFEQGSPSTALVHFLMEEAPDDRLIPGASLRMFERETQQLARVEILD